MRGQLRGRLLVAALVSLLAIPALPAAVVHAGSATHLQVTTTATNPQVAGVAFEITVTAFDAADSIDTAFAGTVTFSGGGTGATVPAEYTFLAGDNGAHTFTGVVLTAVGTQTISAADTVTPSIAGFTDLLVGPADAATLMVAGYPSPTTVGVSQAFTVTARDTYGNVASGYMGTVGFSSDDPLASLPAGYAFVPGDNGAHGFSATFGTAGTRSLTATDTTISSITGTQAGIAVGKRDQAIAFTSTAPTAAAVGGATYMPTATATSGLGVTFLIDAGSSGVCAIAAGVVSFVAVGTCTINADQAGNANWNAALRQQQSFGVGLGTTTTGVVSSASPSTYGGSVTFTASVANADWTATGTVTFKDGAATLGAGILSGGVAAFTTSALVAGDHAITAVYGGDGHLAQSTSGALTQTVAKATLTVTADPASRPYGAANPAFTATTSGLVNGDAAAVVTGAAACSTPATPTDPVGAYPVTCDVTGMSAADYTFTPVAGTLTITPAASAIDLAGLPAGGVGVYEAKVPAAFTATFGPTVGSAVPAGMATFLVDGVARPPVAIVGGLATLPNVMFVTTGTHQVAVRYAGDGGNFGPAPDSALAVPVVANTVRASSVGVSGTSIYPVTDSWRDTIAVRGNRLEPLSVSISIYSPTGSRVRTKTFARASGSYAYTWNGRTSSRTILAAGKYKVVQVLADAYGARRTYTSYVTLSRKRMYWYTKTLTVLSGPRNYQMRSTTNTSVLSAPSSTTSRALGMVNATDSPTWIAVGYQFSLPSASTYRSLSFQVRGSWTGATAPKIGLIPWNGGSWGSIYSLTRARATMGTSTSSYYAQTLTSLRGIVSGRSVRASIDSFAMPSGYGPGPFRYSITAVRLVVRYGILR